MRAAIVLLALIAASAASDFYLCNVKVPDFCATQNLLAKDGACMDDPSLTMNGDAYDITTGFNVISFGDFLAYSDTEGRVLVGGNGQLGHGWDGYSIGEKVYTKGPGATDERYPYAAVFGGDLEWDSGRLCPDGMDQFSAAFNEDLYVANSFTGSADLAQRRTANQEDITYDMQNAQRFYTQLQVYLDSFPTNGHMTTAQGGFCTFVCDSASASSYYIDASATALATCTSYDFQGCSVDASMVITVPGNDDVFFTSGAIQPTQRDAAKTVFNILGSGRTINFKWTRFYGIILAPNNHYKSEPQSGATDGIIIVNDVIYGYQMNRINCTRPPPVDEPSPCVSFEAACAGTSFFDGLGDTRDYNVISFGNFIADTGDVEGRVMTRGNFVAGNGYSIGYLLQTGSRADRSEGYSLIAGGSCTWGSGALYPDGTGIPYSGDREDMFCGGSASVPDYLADRVSGSCEGNAGCLDAIFDAAYGCYNGYSEVAAAASPNVAVVSKYQGLFITCDDNTTEAYFADIDSAVLSAATYYVTSNCNFQAYWTINVRGTGDVELTGDSFPAPAGAVLYNIPGDRIVYVHDTAVNGHILAVDATLNQPLGVILGKVVVGDVTMSKQINKENTCQQITTTDVPLYTCDGVQPGDDRVCTCGSSPNSNGADFESDSFPAGTQQDGTDGNCIIMSQAADSYVAKNSRVGTLKVASDAGGNGRPVTTPQNGSASSIVVSIALLAVALLF